MVYGQLYKTDSCLKKKRTSIYKTDRNFFSLYGDSSVIQFISISLMNSASKMESVKILYLWVVVLQRSKRIGHGTRSTFIHKWFPSGKETIYNNLRQLINDVYPIYLNNPRFDFFYSISSEDAVWPLKRKKYKKCFSFKSL